MYQPFFNSFHVYNIRISKHISDQEWKIFMAKHGSKPPSKILRYDFISYQVTNNYIRM